MDPLPPKLYARHAGTNALGLGREAREDRALIVVNLNAMWSDAADDVAVDTAVRSLIKVIERSVGELDALDPFLYINYAAPWQHVVDGYGEVNIWRLREVQDIYDPYHVFTQLVPGGFKIPELPLAAAE